ncbi:MAG: hypothetical protein RIN55_08715 [Tissierellaceae bacterium]|nr:hypothetical protein [Tissierellaceae bacterium]
MKKTILVLALILALGLSVSFAYASDNTTDINIEEWRQWFQERMDWRREEIKDALDNGIITEDEAKTWDEHIDYMEEFHVENGFIPGGCHGGRFNRNSGNIPRMGNGMMMRGLGWNR